MPTYEYHCETCGKNFDVFQSMRDQPLTECPQAQCQMAEWGHGKVKRLFGTGAGLIFKGSGFYITDYRSANYKEAAKKEAPSGAGEKTGKESGGSSSTSSSAPAAPAKTPEKKAKPAAE